MSSMSDRDRKIMLAIVPLVVILAYWFLLLSPKRDEAATAKQDEPEGDEQDHRHDHQEDLAIAIRHAAHDPPPRDAGTLPAPFGVSSVSMGANVTVTLNL